MKKRLIVALLVLAMVLPGFGCSHGDSFGAVDEKTRAGLLDLLESAALGGKGDHTVAIAGAAELGQVTGTIDKPLTDCEALSVSIFEGKYIEVERIEVAPEGNWGPLLLVNEPWAIILLKDEELKGYSLSKPRYAAVLTGGTSYSDFLVDPRDTGLVALALTYSEKYQEAANLLAGLQSIHPQFSGLPKETDIFGGSLSEEVDYTATAWVGYATSVLARITDNPDIWHETKKYASYLEVIPVPEDIETLVAGSLLFFELAKKDPAYSAIAEKWQPAAGDSYNPLIGLWLEISQGKAKDYVDTAYNPESAVDRWVHYSLLAASGKLPADLDLSVESVPGGIAVTDGGKISLSATSWMVIALGGGLGN